MKKIHALYTYVGTYISVRNSWSMSTFLKQQMKINSTNFALLLLLKMQLALGQSYIPYLVSSYPKKLNNYLKKNSSVSW